MAAKFALFRSKIDYAYGQACPARRGGTPPPLAGQAWGNLINKI
jgi:hypothetical protein